MTCDDTIIAIASPQGGGARGIVRLSGPRAVEAASRILESPIPDGTYLVHETRLVLPDTAPFGVAVYVMRAPRSYTREDVIEIHAPGSPPLLAAILSSLAGPGVRLAQPGEFTRRAFLSGRIDLAQAEAVLSVIRAQNDNEERLALSALSGQVSSRVRAIRAKLVELSSDIEAGLDFVEDGVTFATRDKKRTEIAAAAQAVRAMLDEALSAHVFNEETLVVIYGPANAGKSSLFNALAGQEIAIVNETPGTTRDLLEKRVVLDGARFVVVDTAGVRPPAETIEQVAISRTRSFVREAQAVLFVVDASKPLSAGVEALYVDAAELPHVVVLNKADKGLVVDAAGWRRAHGAGAAIEASAATGAGLSEIQRALAGLVRRGAVDMSTGRFLFAARQAECLKCALEALSRASLAVEAGEPDEIVSLFARESVEALGRVTGEDYVEDLLDDVFSRFCLGK